MIDNLQKIKPFLKFESDDDFYYLQILQRKKENPQLGSNSRVIKNYYINSVDYLLDRYDEIKTLCNVFNARASLRLNKRSYKKTAFKTIQNVANTMSNGEFFHVKKSYDRACGLGHNDKNKKWILDIDDKGLNTLEFVDNIDNYMKKCKPNEGKSKILIKLDSKNGFHLITSPFDLKTFNKEFPEIEIHKDNPTNLYIP